MPRAFLSSLPSPADPLFLFFFSCFFSQKFSLALPFLKSQLPKKYCLSDCYCPPSPLQQKFWCATACRILVLRSMPSKPCAKNCWMMFELNISSIWRSVHMHKATIITTTKRVTIIVPPCTHQHPTPPLSSR